MQYRWYSCNIADTAAVLIGLQYHSYTCSTADTATVSLIELQYCWYSCSTADTAAVPLIQLHCSLVSKKALPHRYTVVLTVKVCTTEVTPRRSFVHRRPTVWRTPPQIDLNSIENSSLPKCDAVSFDEQCDVLKEPSASAFRDKDSTDSDPEGDSSKNPRNVGGSYLHKSTASHTVIHNSSCTALLRTSEVYTGIIYFVFVHVFVLGDASKLTATALECSTWWHITQR